MKTLETLSLASHAQDAKMNTTASTTSRRGRVKAAVLLLASLFAFSHEVQAQACVGTTATAGGSNQITCVEGGTQVIQRAVLGYNSGNQNTSGDISVTSTGPDLDIIKAAATGNVLIDTSASTGTARLTVSNNAISSNTMGMLSAVVGSGGLVVDITGDAPISALGPPPIGPPVGRLTTVGQGKSGVDGGMTVGGSGSLIVNLFREEFYSLSLCARTPGQCPTFGDSLADWDVVPIHALDTHFARLQGAVNFADLTGGASVNIGSGGLWVLNNDVSVLSPADDLIHVMTGGVLTLQSIGNTFSDIDIDGNPSRTHVIDFGGGNDDRVVNEGQILVGLRTDGTQTGYAAELRMEHLGTLENHGEIIMGAAFERIPGVGDIALGLADDPAALIHNRGSDRTTDDMLSLPGATFVGGETGRIVMDMALASLRTDQDRCDSTMRDADGTLPVADCINLQNGAIEGVMYLDASSTSIRRAGYNPDGNVIVDLSNGSGGPGTGAGAAQGQVAFAPETAFYNPAFGGVIDNGIFMSILTYDEETSQFKLASVPSGGALHQPLIANAALSGWRTANGSFFDRQADLRDTLRAGERRSSGAWGRSSVELGERDLQQSFSTGITTYGYDSAHDVETSTVTVGADFMGSGDAERYWIVGGMLGYVRTDIEYARFYTDTVAMNGMLLGLYGSYVNGPMFVDATISGIWTRMDQDMPQAELFRDSLLSTDIQTEGLQVEGGWRFDLGAARLEPLVNLSLVRTKVDDFKVPEEDPTGDGNQIMFETATSRRVGLGLRGSTQFAVLGDLQLGLSLTGRYQNEMDGESKAAIGNLNPISPEVVDEFDGAFTELIGGVTLANATGRVSGVLNVGTKQGDDLSTVSASASFRYQW